MINVLVSGEGKTDMGEVNYPYSDLSDLKKGPMIYLIEQMIKNAENQEMRCKMVSVFDVAAFILREKDTMPAMKLQKLVYYCQAWSLIWDEQALFEEPIEAWANGPVVREL